MNNVLGKRELMNLLKILNILQKQMNKKIMKIKEIIMKMINLVWISTINKYLNIYLNLNKSY
jgi:hypothetical protein